MTAKEWAAKSMSRFKHAAFDPVAMQSLEVATEQVVAAAVLEEREACAKIADDKYEWNSEPETREIAELIRKRATNV